MRLIKGLTPNWFTVGMGTGILALDAFALPKGAWWLKDIGTGFWLFNMILVGLLCGLMIIKGLYDRAGIRAILNHPVQSMFFGAIPMAMTTVVNGFFEIAPKYLSSAYHIGAVLWILNAVLALISVFLVPYWMFTRHEHELSKMTGIWLMPIVPAEVVAASSGILLPHIVNIALRQDLFVGTVVLWAFSVPMAFLMLGILFMRLVLHKLPPQDMAISTWITLGTLGTGVMGLVSMANDSRVVFPALAGGIKGGAILLAIMLWGLGVWWFGQSMLMTGYYVLRKRLTFNLGWWGLTFPLGVFGGGTDLLYKSLGTNIFRITSIGFFIMLVGFWILVAIFTIRHLHELMGGKPSVGGHVADLPYARDEAV